MTILPWAQHFGASFGCRALSSHVLAHTHARARTYIYTYMYILTYIRRGRGGGVCEMVRRLGVAGVSSPLQWSPGQTVRSIEGRGYTFLGGGHPALCRPSAYAIDDDRAVPPSMRYRRLSSPLVSQFPTDTFLERREVSLSENFARRFSREYREGIFLFLKRHPFFSLLLSVTLFSRKPGQDSLSFPDVASNVLSRRCIFAST